MGINEDGYLSEDIGKWSAEQRAWHPEHFRLVTEINRTGEVVQRHLSRLPRTTQAVLASGYFVRALQSYQGAVLMAERGLFTEALTLCRSTLETLFYLGAIRRDPSFGEQLGQNHIHDMKKSAASYIEALEGDADGEATKTLEVAISEVEKMGIKPTALKIWAVAKKANMEKYYKGWYMDYSVGAAHPTVIALDPIWARSGPTEEPTGVSWGIYKSDKRDMPDVLLKIALLGILVIREMNDVLRIKFVGDELEQHTRLHLKLLDRVSGPSASL